MTKSKLIITQKWYDNRDNLRTKEFDDLLGAFQKLGISEEYLMDNDSEEDDYDELGEAFTTALDDLDIVRTNDKIFKLFDYIYKYKHTEYFPTADKNIKIDDVTGFCDVTDFLKTIKNDFEIDYCHKALEEFMSYGGIVRVDGKDFVRGDINLREIMLKVVCK